jgi:hypothetical protein
MQRLWGRGERFTRSAASQMVTVCNATLRFCLPKGECVPDDKISVIKTIARRWLNNYGRPQAFLTFAGQNNMSANAS